MNLNSDLPVLRLRTQAAWEAWLEKHHASAKGAWLTFAKKDSGKTMVTYAEAVESGLCFGWIDGQSKSVDSTYWVQRFTPRRPRSKWSQVNCGKATALLAAGRMRPAGIREMERAKQDGRWSAAYAPQSTITVPDDLRSILAKHPRARKNFEALDSKNRYAILYRIQDAKKPETRARRIQKFVAMLNAGQTIH